MGYESKFYAVRKYNFDSDVKGYRATEIVATLDMCKMGYSDKVAEFLGLFDTKADFTLRLEDYNNEKDRYEMMDIIEDKYGSPLCYISDKEEGIKVVKEMIKQDDYWRFPLLLKFLKMFRDCDNVYIVHYGY